MNLKKLFSPSALATTVASGMLLHTATHKEIAERLGVSLKMADKLTHVIFGKLRTRGGRIEAVTMWNSAR